MKHGRTLRLGIPVGALLTLSLGLAAPALADSANATVSIVAGALTETATGSPSFTATLNGTNQTVRSTALQLAAIDLRGNGAGWNVTITSTQFTTGGSLPRTLPATATTVRRVTTACGGGSCTAPTNSINFPLTVPAAATAPPAVKLFNAAAGSGLGSNTLTPRFRLSIPANTYAGTYTSRMTFSIVSAP